MHNEGKHMQSQLANGEGTTSFMERPVYKTFVAHQAMRSALASKVSVHNLTATDCAVLEAVSEEPGLSGVELAERCIVTKQALALVLGKLEKRQLLVRKTTPGMGRTRRTYLTDDGLSLALTVRHTLDDLQDRALAPLAPKETEILKRLLEQYATAWKALAPD